MFPNLLPGFSYRVKYVPIGRLKPGDVVVIRTDEAGLLAHRMVRRVGHCIVTKGDACDGEDAPHPPISYLGRIEDRVLGPIYVPRSFVEPLFKRIFGRPDPPLCIAGARWAAGALRRLRRLSR